MQHQRGGEPANATADDNRFHFCAPNVSSVRSPRSPYQGCALPSLRPAAYGATGIGAYGERTETHVPRSFSEGPQPADSTLIGLPSRNARMSSTISRK